jgi:hypothetical protein
VSWRELYQGTTRGLQANEWLARHRRMVARNQAVLTPLLRRCRTPRSPACGPQPAPVPQQQQKKVDVTPVKKVDTDPPKRGKPKPARNPNDFVVVRRPPPQVYDSGPPVSSSTSRQPGCLVPKFRRHCSPARIRSPNRCIGRCGP